MATKREYVVTLKSHTDLDKFYDDMESRGGSGFVPNRQVDVKHRRPLSRNTHYLMFESEAERLKNDPRVISVELSIQEQGLKIVPLWEQTSSFWNKSNAVSSSHKNWGLYRSIAGYQIPNWGDNGTTNVSGTITTTSSGKNVDVVIVDGHINPGHPEFAVNVDGTGGSRVNQFNWFSLNSVLGLTAFYPNTYVYTPYVDASYPDYSGNGISDRTDDNDHGAHVASSACGNTCGWARDANIYNISPYSTNPNSISAEFILDYVNAFHNLKPINPVTGRKNPTVTNHSYGVAAGVTYTSIVSVNFRGTEYTGPFTESQLRNYGIYINDSIAYFPVRYAPFEADMEDLMDNGIILVGAAGNEYTKIENYSTSASSDYQNYLRLSTGTVYYYHRGSITSTPGAICVGNVSSAVNEGKRTSSDCGPRIDVYAPGSLIMGAVNSSVGVTVGDQRNTAYRLTKKSGTSMASPQVAGVLACLAEQWPRMSQSDAKKFIIDSAKDDQMYDSQSTSLSDYTSLQGSDNKYLYYKKVRTEEGQISPGERHGNRYDQGMVFPRSKIYRYGR